MILTAVSVALPASLLGVLLVMKRMIMVGDAISHAVLPGIVIAFLMVESRESIPMLFGAAITGVLTTLLIDFLKRKLRVQEDAAIGTAFTFLFALGVLLIAFYAGKNADLDQECVLYGDLETSILDQIIWNGRIYGTRAIAQLFPLIVIVLVVLIIGNKGWKIWAFNSDFGGLKGMKTSVWQLVLMMLVSVHAVLSFESVGVIMVVGLLVLPPACALQLTHKYANVFIYSAGIGILACVIGVLVGEWINISIAPTIVSINGLIFTMIVLAKQLKTKLMT